MAFILTLLIVVIIFALHRNSDANHYRELYLESLKKKKDA